MSWLDAQYSWGALDPATGVWDGVVGHTLYGRVDVGMCNIDMTHSRYQVIDYSHYIRQANSHSKIIKT